MNRDKILLGVKAQLLISLVVMSASAAMAQGTQTYTVRPGDTLTRVAQMHDLTTSELRALNNLESDMVRVGQRLIISRQVADDILPEGVHSVSQGETLYSIADLYGVSVDSLLRYNSLENTPLHEGQSIILPPTGRTIRHRVEAGETLMALYRRYGASPEAIRRANNLRTDQINVGQVLEIPRSDALSTTTQTPEVRTEPGKVLVYPETFDGRLMAGGEEYDPAAFAVSHRTLPLNTIVLLTNPENGRKTFAVVMDRGPLEEGFIMDVSRATARKLGLGEDDNISIEWIVVD